MKKTVIQSESKRTTVTITMAPDGTILILVDRDGRRVHHLDVMREPIPND